MITPILSRKQMTFYFILSLSLMIFLPVSSENDTFENRLLYKVTNSNETTNTWFNEDFSKSYSYLIENSSDITIEFDDLKNINTRMNIQVGNLTRQNITDFEAEGNLAIGYWQIPEVLGFVASKDWESTRSSLNGLENVSSSLSEKPDSYKFNAETLSIVEITIQDAFQQTTLVYDSNNGYLILASTNVFGFLLEFELQNRDIPQLSTDPFFLSFSATWPLIGLSLGIIIYKIYVRDQRYYYQAY